MPSIADINQFKSLIYRLGEEPDERKAQGLPPLDIRPPESQVDEGLAGLLGDMPLSDSTGSALDTESVLSGSTRDPLADLFSGESKDTSAPGGDFNLDDLLSGMGSPGGALDPDSFMTDDLGFGKSEGEGPSTSEFSLEDLDFGGGTEKDASQIENTSSDEFDAKPSRIPFDATEDKTSGGEVEDPFAGMSLDEALATDSLPTTDHTGADIWDSPDTDFLLRDLEPEMKGLAETTESEVESYDESAEADEFNLDEFGYAGTEGDFVGDEAVLNPATLFEVPDSVERPLTITDDEFIRLQNNLNLYPLNLKIAIEELLGERDLKTADANNLVRQLVNGISARAMAQLAGRLLERKIEIPAGFEKGSGELLEAQQASILFHARRTLLPILIRFVFLTAAVGMVVFLLGTFLYRPARAHWLYEEGLKALAQNREADSEALFLEAVGMNDVPSWYLRYAEAYMGRGDLGNARIKFLQLLRPAYTTPESRLRLLPQRPAQVQEDLEKMGYSGPDLLGAGFPEKDPDRMGYRVEFMRPYLPAFLMWAAMETEKGFDGTSSDKQFLIAENLLQRVLDAQPGHKSALLQAGDLYLGWGKALLDERRPGLIRFTTRDTPTLRRSANRLYTEYTRLYGRDTPVTFRWIAYFLGAEITGEELQKVLVEMRLLREGMDERPELRPHGLLLARWAGWHFDREDERLYRLGLPQDFDLRIRASLARGESVELLEETLPLREATGLEDFRIYFFHPFQFQTALRNPQYRPSLYVSYRTPSGQLREPLGPRENPARMDIVPGGGGWYTSDLSLAGIVPGQRVLLTMTLNGQSLTGNREFERDRTGWLLIEDGFPMWHPREPAIRGRGLLVNREPPSIDVTQQDIQTFRDWLLDAQAGVDGTVPEVHFQLARFFRFSGQRGEEKKALSAADYFFRVLPAQEQRRTERLAARIETLVRIAEIHRENRAIAQAEISFQEARSLFESSQELKLWVGQRDQARLYGNLGDLYFVESGDWAVALSFYDKALGYGALTESQRYRRAVALFQQNRFNEALDQFFLLERIPALSGNRNLRYALAATMFRLGNYGSSEELYSELYEHYRSRVESLVDWAPQERETDREIARNYYRVMNNLAATRFFSLAGGDRNHPSFGDVLSLMIEAKGVEDALSRRFGPNPEELVRTPDEGLVGLNLRELLGGEEEPLIFPGLPLDLDATTF